MTPALLACLGLAASAACHLFAFLRCACCARDLLTSRS